MVWYMCKKMRKWLHVNRIPNLSPNLAGEARRGGAIQPCMPSLPFGTTLGQMGISNPIQSNPIHSQFKTSGTTSNYHVSMHMRRCITLIIEVILSYWLRDFSPRARQEFNIHGTDPIRASRTLFFSSTVKASVDATIWISLGYTIITIVWHFDHSGIALHRCIVYHIIRSKKDSAQLCQGSGTGDRSCTSHRSPASVSRGIDK